MLAIIGGTVILTFFVLWYPFVYQGLDSVSQVLLRIFPINRGLFEVKIKKISLFSIDCFILFINHL